MAAPTLYIVTDFKTVPDSATGGYAVLTNSTSHQSRNGAEERYHTALATAARSTQYSKLGAIMMTNDGFVIESRCFEHDEQPEPEPVTVEEGD